MDYLAYQLIRFVAIVFAAAFLVMVGSVVALGAGVAWIAWKLASAVYRGVRKRSSARPPGPLPASRPLAPAAEPRDPTRWRLTYDGQWEPRKATGPNIITADEIERRRRLRKEVARMIEPSATVNEQVVRLADGEWPALSDEPQEPGEPESARSKIPPRRTHERVVGTPPEGRIDEAGDRREGPASQPSRAQRVAELIIERKGRDGGMTPEELHEVYLEVGYRSGAGGNNTHTTSRGWAWLERHDDGMSYVTAAAHAYLGSV
jgi:hypothetical protein